jgi:hypothetical protein
MQKRDANNWLPLADSPAVMPQTTLGLSVGCVVKPPHINANRHPSDVTGFALAFTVRRCTRR